MTQEDIDACVVRDWRVGLDEACEAVRRYTEWNRRRERLDAGLPASPEPERRGHAEDEGVRAQRAGSDPDPDRADSHSQVHQGSGQSTALARQSAYSSNHGHGSVDPGVPRQRTIRFEDEFTAVGGSSAERLSEDEHD